MRISDWSSDVCSSDLMDAAAHCPVHLRKVMNLRRLATQLLERGRARCTKCVVAREKIPIKQVDLPDLRFGNQVEDIGARAAKSHNSNALGSQLFVEGRSEEHPSELQSLMSITYAG